MITDKRVIANNYIGRLMLEIMFIDYVPDWWWWIEFADVSRN